MILTVTVTNEALEAALYQTGPRLILSDYHDLLGAVAAITKKTRSITGVVAIIGPVSFTRHRQTIALVNAFAATKGIPAVAYEYTETPPDDARIQKLVDSLKRQTPGTPIVPEYRAEPTITMKR